MIGTRARLEGLMPFLQGIGQSNVTKGKIHDHRSMGIFTINIMTLSFYLTDLCPAEMEINPLNLAPSYSTPPSNSGKTTESSTINL